MKGKTVIITGGTGGIGQQTAIGLARLGARILITGRHAQRGAEAESLIKLESGNRDVQFVQGNLSSLSAVATLSSTLLEQVSRLDVLINNAGVFAKELIKSDDGFESGFAVNVAAPLALTLNLRPALKAAAPSRVINVTGGSPSTILDIDNLQAEKGLDGLNTYSHTKRAMEAMSVILAKKLVTEGIYLNIVYPGQAATSMTRSVTTADVPWFMRPIWPLVSRRMQKDDGGVSASKASRSSVWAASTSELDGVSGSYFDRSCAETQFNESVQNLNNQQYVYDCATSHQHS